MLEKQFPTPFFFNGSILDFETDFELKPICIGVLNGGIVKICIATSERDSRFIESARGLLLNLRHPAFAYVKSFEEKICASYFGLDRLILTEIQLVPFEAKRDALKVKHIADPYHGVGAKVMHEWQAYLSDGFKTRLDRIMQHNLCCVLQELSLVILSECMENPNKLSTYTFHNSNKL